MTHSLFKRAQGLVELIASDPLRSQVISYLSRELAPSNEPAAVAFGQLSRDGRLHVIAHEGFAHFDPSTLSDLHIDSERASSIALRTLRLTLYNESELRSYQGDLPKDLQSYWYSAVAMPISLHAIYFINFRTDVTLLRDVDDFLHCISSILTSFELAHQAKSGKKVDPWYKAEAQSLSLREEKILELIRSGMTNAEIAHEIGYSESLIRQETVAIYRKLGVSGRKEIKDEDSTQERRTRSMIQIAIALSGIEVLLPILEILDSTSVLYF